MHVLEAGCGRPRAAVAPTAAVLLALCAGAAGAEAQRYVRDGVAVEFAATPVAGAGPLMEGELAELRFRIVDDASGQPMRGLAPGAWLDRAERIRGQARAEQKSCKDKVALYLRGSAGIRPMADLNGYYVFVLNREASVSVIDPKVSMAGRTSTFASIALPGAGADLARSHDDRYLFVSMPSTGEVAVIDADSFRLRARVRAAPGVTRLAVQPDGRYLWAGNDDPGRDRGSVTVIDTESLAPVVTLPVGSGHHEIAFSADSRWAFVTNRGDGTVSVVDVRSLRVERELAVGGQPISVAFSALSQRLFVADAKSGTVHVIRPDDFSTVARIALAPGLGPMRFTPDGRWAMVLNTVDDRVYVLDPSNNSVQHEIPVAGQPYQIAFTRAFAYVRALGSERVSMIDLSSLGPGRRPSVLGFAAGAAPPKAAGDLVIADSIAPAAGDAGVLVVNPAENSTYFYMEGMNAAASNYKVQAASARAVAVVDRSLREIEPGVYATRLKIPAAGNFDIAFALDSPRLLHCFSVVFDENPQRAAARAGVKAEYIVESREIPIGRPFTLRLRLTDQRSGVPRTGIADLRVRIMLASGRQRSETVAREVGGGVYEASLTVEEPGAYFVHTASATLGKRFGELPYLTLYTPAPRIAAGRD